MPSPFPSPSAPVPAADPTQYEESWKAIGLGLCGAVIAVFWFGVGFVVAWLIHP